MLGQEVPPAVKNFSLFRHALKISQKPRVDLGEVAGLCRRDFHERESFLFRAQESCLKYACLMIENALLMRTNRSGRIYAGFEKLSLMQPVVDRYLRIADISETVYVFGEDDWKPPRHPNMRNVTLRPQSSLTRESFLIADCSTYHAALVAMDEDGFDGEEADERHFTVFKSSNPAVVNQLALAVEGMIDWSFAA